MRYPARSDGIRRVWSELKRLLWQPFRTPNFTLGEGVMLEQAYVLLVVGVRICDVERQLSERAITASRSHFAEVQVQFI